MKFANEKLNDMEIDEKDIIHFKEGIPGFEEFKDYVLLQEQEVPFIMTLQSVDAQFPSFVVVDPFAFVKDYNPNLSQSDLKYFNSENEDDLRFLLITVVPKDIKDTVVNLKSPLVISSKTNEAKQVILDNQDYPVRYSLFAEV